MGQRKQLSEIMNPKKFVCLPGSATAAMAAKKMLERQVGAIVVMEDGKLLGIVTERDINYRLVAIGRDPGNTTLVDIMTRSPRTMTPDTPVVDALDLMQKHGYRHVPVAEEGKIIGIVSLSDIFNAVKHALEQDIEESEHFIVGSGTTH